MDKTRLFIKNLVYLWYRHMALTWQIDIGVFHKVLWLNNVQLWRNKSCQITAGSVGVGIPVWPWGGSTRSQSRESEHMLLAN